MTIPNVRTTSSRRTINEGIVKKGGVNKPPTSPRPARPIGQGGSSSSNQKGSNSSNQKSSSSS